MQSLIVANLSKKYSQSVDYYYGKAIAEFLAGSHSVTVIRFQALLEENEPSEYLRRFYFRHEYKEKMVLLGEYYKFHNEIPRIFIPSVSDTMNNYHDKRRRIEYFRILRVIETENKQNPNKPKKAIVGDKPEESELEKSKKVYGKMLYDLTDHSTTIEDLTQKLKTLRFPQEDLELLPSARDQDQLNQFVKFINAKHKSVIQSPPQSAQKISAKKYDFNIKQTLTKKPSIGTFSISPRPQVQATTVYNKFKMDLTKLKSGCQTHRIVKDLKILPAKSTHLLTQTQVQTTKSGHNPKKFSFVEPTKQLSQHQHTRSDVRLLLKK